MKYQVKVDAGAGKVETYTTEAPDAAAAMLQAYDKYGVCGVTVSPVEQESARNTALEEAAVLCETAELFFSAELWLHSTKQDMTANTAIELADKIRALKSAAPACPVDTAIANLDALLAERRASTMDHAQLAALGRAAAPAGEQIPAVLFDGMAVYADVMANDPRTPRPTADNIADVLDAVVRLIRKETK